MPKRKRKFSGKVFEFDGDYGLKPEATGRADILRLTGWLVRLVKVVPKRGRFVSNADGVFYARRHRWEVWKRKK